MASSSELDAITDVLIAMKISGLIAKNEIVQECRLQLEVDETSRDPNGNKEQKPSRDGAGLCGHRFLFALFDPPC